MDKKYLEEYLTYDEQMDEKYPIEYDASGIAWIRGDVHHVWMQPRPRYCDRGHWIAHVQPAPGVDLKYSIDDSDKWPRYYMDFHRMVDEVRDWLAWRESDGPTKAGDLVFGRLLT